mmetsp:Transcript_53372/g.155559  ORF Transcript_53372/g.155559 Transcript_53372/m.155559 type:complete len:247 (-) Transcript_53372:106-846(-)
MAQFHVALAGLLLAVAQAITKELYTTNAVCKQRYCVNPAFPGLADLQDLGGQTWTKHSLANVSGFLEFCAGVVNYDVALLQPNGTLSLLERHVAASGGNMARLMSQTELIVRDLDKRALKTYFIHLSAMGIEAWDHTEPMMASSHPLRPCARSVARLSCFTYFPTAYNGLSDGAEIAYIRPCRNACQSYIQTCNVDCCDDSTSCVWDKSAADGISRTTQDASGNMVMLDTGYMDADGPTFSCTGSG